MHSVAACSGPRHNCGGHLHRTSGLNAAQKKASCLFPYGKFSSQMEKTATSGNVNRKRELYSPSSQPSVPSSLSPIEWVGQRRSGQGSPPVSGAFLGEGVQNNSGCEGLLDAACSNPCSRQGNFKATAVCSGPCPLEFWASQAVKIPHSLPPCSSAALCAAMSAHSCGRS